MLFLLEHLLIEFHLESQSESNEEDKYENDRYINAKLIINIEETILSWWKKCTVEYPKLSNRARSLFDISLCWRTKERIFIVIGRRGIKFN